MLDGLHKVCAFSEVSAEVNGIDYARSYKEIGADYI